MLAQFIPLYCALVGGSLAAAVAAIHMSLRFNAQTVRARAAIERRTPPLDLG